MNDIIMEIITNSILFDDNVKARSFCNLTELHEDIKTDIYDFGLLTELKEIYMDDVYELLKELILINQSIIKQLNTIKNSKSSLDITKKTLVLFYKYDCYKTNELLPLWFKLKELYRTTYNFLSINIDMLKYEKVVDVFNIKTTTLLCLSNNNIYTFNGKMNINAIITFIKKI